MASPTRWKRARWRCSNKGNRHEPDAICADDPSPRHALRGADHRPGRRASASGRRVSVPSPCCSATTRRTPMHPVAPESTGHEEPGGWFELTASGGAGRQPLPLSAADGTAGARPGLALQPGRRARAHRGHRPGRLRLEGRRLARPAVGRGGHLRTARRHLHAGGHLRRRRSERSTTSSELGVTALELMPVADFPGQRNWGYDGVLPFAPGRGLRHARTTSSAWSKPPTRAD